MAAQKGAESLRKNADKKANQIVQEADVQANKLVEEAKAKKAEMINKIWRCPHSYAFFAPSPPEGGYDF